MMPLPERIAERIVEDEHGCWLWQGPKLSGYGSSSHGGKSAIVHRLVYTLLVGDVPSGLELDHLCRVRSCCNPEHLEPVTHSENVRRGDLPRLNRERAASQTHCKHGHEYTEENTYRSPKGHRFCHACRRLKQRPGVYCCDCGAEISFNKAKPAQRCKSCATRFWKAEKRA